MTDATATRPPHPVARALKSCAVDKVVVIDDIYDLVDVDAVSKTALQTFWDYVREDDDAIETLNGLGIPIEDARSCTAPTLRKLASNAELFGDLKNIWRDTLAPYFPKTGELHAFARHLERELGIRVLQRGQNEIYDDEVCACKIVFLDYMLEVSTPSLNELSVNNPEEVRAAEHRARVEARDRAVKKAKSVLAWNEKEQPLIVLMSHYSAVLDDADNFCEETGLLGGRFYCVTKGELTDTFKLEMNMHMFAMSMANGQHLQRFVSALSSTVVPIAETFVRHVRELTLADYSYLYQLSLGGEGQPLGEYAFEAFGAYLNNLLFAKELATVRDELDGVTFQHFLPVRAVPSQRINEIYKHTVLEVVDDDLRHPWHRMKSTAAHSVTNRQGAMDAHESAHAPEASELEAHATGLASAPADGSNSEAESAGWPYLSLGDIFLEKENGDITHKVHMVINAPCDLAREGDPTESVILVQGLLREFGSPDPDEKSGKGKGKGKNDRAHETALFQYERTLYRIVWRVKHVTSVPYGDFGAWRKETDPKNGWKRVARLRPAHAHEIQQAFATNLTRGGKPAATQYYRRATMKLYRVLRDNNKILFKDDVTVEPSERAFLLHSMGENKTRCVLTAQLIWRIRETTLSLVGAAEGKASADDTEAWLRLTAPLSVAADGTVTGPGGKNSDGKESGKSLVLPPGVAIRRNFEPKPGWNPPKGVVIVVAVNDHNFSSAEADHGPEHE